MAGKLVVRSKPMPAAMRAALGEVVISFGLLEARVDQAIWALRGWGRKEGRKHTHNVMLSPRLKMLREANEARFAASTEAHAFFNAVRTDAYALSLRRNVLVHGIWGKGKARGTRRRAYVVSYFNQIGGERWHVTVEQLRGFKDHIVALSKSIEPGVQKHLGIKLP